ncbi:hypothetical protein AJ78_02132 [Emergomyces pasteurianus Ep9510]|uniref:Protein-lysine N-methyltransferase EFM4 n=1 Tax=Emergomyces pasteurianus Ep9510 TaxID=1447872 RepID=A0A1J9QPI1_9EURO|nr:hypothetical protein AJ78_02132 [Emergomyces pasteurianus Ep9510]
MAVIAPPEGVDDHPPLLEPSQLGTKEYWESFYDNSLSHLSSKRRNRGKCQGQIGGEGEANDRDEGADAEEQEAAEDQGEGADDYDNDRDEDDDDDDDDDDPGTSWFTEHNAPEKVMRFLTSQSFPLAPCNNTQSQSQSQPKILDLGTGNGSMLALLRDEGGFTGGQLVGVDYSPKSIELARRLHESSSPSAAQDEADTTPPAIRFEVWDIFDKRAVQDLDWFPATQGGFDIVLDKGTFDAISLSAEEIVDESAVGKTGGGGGGENVDMKGSRTVQKRVCESYPGIVRGLVRKGGFLVVTSCNWTEEELIRWFTRREEGEGREQGDRLVVWDRVEYPKFRFGGQEGQGVCTVCFRRVSGS